MSHQDKIKIVIADDHTSVRQAYVSSLLAMPQFEIVGQAENGQKLLSLIQQVKPDIVLLDIEMPVMNGIEVLDKVRNSGTKVKCIILSMYSNEGIIAKCTAWGACAYLNKGCDIDEIFKAIIEVHEKGYYFTTSSSQVVIKSISRMYKKMHQYGNSLLTERELEIIQLICSGKTNKEIADEVFLAASTIDFHRQNIYRKTNCKNLSELVKYAIRTGISPV
jgi:DNA-binding NarL/FixJ family response regulator